MRIFLTGGHGFIGSRVTRQLANRGHNLRLLLREKSKTHRIDEVAFERARGDVRDKQSLVEAMTGMDACIHLASVSSWKDIRSGALEPTIIDGTRNLIEAAKEAGVKRLVFVSSILAVNASTEPKVFDETSPFQLSGTKLRYSLAKHEAEKMVFAAAGTGGLETVIVNPGEVYGREDEDFITAGNIKDILSSWPAIACKGGNPVCYVDDIADGIVAALDKGRSGERYILGGDNLTVEETVRLALEIAGKKSPVMVLPNGLVKGLINGLAKLRLPTPAIPEVLDYATLYWFVDSSKAKRELGYNPRAARECIAPVIAWLYEAGHGAASR
jgi:dihydroflavonol-4-reductase